jgi:hypothetical protein
MKLGPEGLLTPHGAQDEKRALGGLSPELLKPLGQLTRAILHRRTNCKHGYAGLCPVFLYRRPGTLGPDQWLSSTDSGPGVHPGDAGSNPCLPPRRTSML